MWIALYIYYFSISINQLVQQIFCSYLCNFANLEGLVDGENTGATLKEVFNLCTKCKFNICLFLLFQYKF